jgi:hypothetical protein
VLSAVGLGEDSNDDYAQFANALLMPLSRAGVTTLTLDNTGHDGTCPRRERQARPELDRDPRPLVVAQPLGARPRQRAVGVAGGEDVGETSGVLIAAVLDVEDRDRPARLDDVDGQDEGDEALPLP